MGSAVVGVCLIKTLVKRFEWYLNCLNLCGNPNIRVTVEEESDGKDKTEQDNGQVDEQTQQSHNTVTIDLQAPGDDVSSERDRQESVLNSAASDNSPKGHRQRLELIASLRQMVERVVESQSRSRKPSYKSNDDDESDENTEELMESLEADMAALTRNRYRSRPHAPQIPLPGSIPPVTLHTR